MLEIFICIAGVIALSLIGCISILHNNHKAQIEDLERAIEKKNRQIEKYLLKELDEEFKDLRQYVGECISVLEDRRTEINNLKTLMKNKE